MFDKDLYQKVLGLSAPWSVANVKMDVKPTQIHVSADHTEVSRWTCPAARRKPLAMNTPERTLLHLTTCQFQALVHARISRAKCPDHNVILRKVPWAVPYGRLHDPVIRHRPLAGLRDREGRFRAVFLG
jgi:transposase